VLGVRVELEDEAVYVFAVNGRGTMAQPPKHLLVCVPFSHRYLLDPVHDQLVMACSVGSGRNSRC
jgi:hypothetical protein